MLLRALALSFLLVVPNAYSQTSLFGATTGAGSLYRINSANGSGTLVAALHDSANHLFGVRALAGDATGQLWGVTSDDSPTAPDSLVMINAGSAIVTVVGPLNAPSGGTASDIGFMSNGTLIGFFPNGAVYGTINLATGQVTALSAPQAIQIGGVAPARSAVLIGASTFPAGTVVSITATSQSPDANLRIFNTGTNTDSSAQSLTLAPCCTFTALETSTTGTIFALAGGALVSIPPNGAVTTLGSVPAGVVGLAFANIPTVTISVSPSPVSLGPSQTQQFTATVGNTGNTTVTWSIPLGAPGSISASGLYTAPSSISVAQSVTVTATSQADPTKTATATVNLVPSAVTISVAPPTVTLGPSQTQTFTATVGNTSNTTVTWSIPGGSPGSINASSGLYTAPATITSTQTVTVTATSQADPTKTATATVTLSPVTISVAPPTASLGPSQTQTFTATVGNSSNTTVTWSIPGGAPGSINSSGVYTAPSSITSPQTVTVTAASQADPTKTATATVTLLPNLSPVPLPPTFWLAALGLVFAALIRSRRYFVPR
jgi:hypothetical protein